MGYVPEESKVIYQSKDGKQEKLFDALEWLAAMCSHVPNKGEQMVIISSFIVNKMASQNAVIVPGADLLLIYLEDDRRKDARTSEKPS